MEVAVMRRQRVLVAGRTCGKGVPLCSGLATASRGLPRPPANLSLIDSVNSRYENTTNKQPKKRVATTVRSALFHKYLSNLFNMTSTLFDK